METTLNKDKSAVMAFESFLAYLQNEIYVLKLANDKFFYDREIELLEEIQDSAVNYSKLYK